MKYKVSIVKIKSPVYDGKSWLKYSVTNEKTGKVWFYGMTTGTRESVTKYVKTLISKREKSLNVSDYSASSNYYAKYKRGKCIEI